MFVTFPCQGHYRHPVRVRQEGHLALGLIMARAQRGCNSHCWDFLRIKGKGKGKKSGVCARTGPRRKGAQLCLSSAKCNERTLTRAGFSTEKGMFQRVFNGLQIRWAGDSELFTLIPMATQQTLATNRRLSFPQSGSLLWSFFPI